MPQPVAASFLSAWEIGKTYDGYLYPDVPDHIFFELPGANECPRQATPALCRRCFLPAGSVRLGWHRLDQAATTERTHAAR